MIAAAVGQITQALNLALRQSTQASENMAVMSHLADADGSAVTQTVDKLAVFLVNIEREAASQRALGRVEFGGGRIGLTLPPVHLNLLLMFVANCSGARYREGLMLIASTIEFFQGRPVLDHQNTPELDPAIERLSIEMEPLDLAALGNLWGVLGSQLRPAVMYRVRMITIDGAHLAGQASAITRPSVALGA